MKGKTIIELRDVERTYTLGEVEVPAIRGISLKIDEGKFTSIVGRSGSGKSTLLNLVGCLDVPTRGKVFVGGKDISKMNEDELAKLRRITVGFVFQQFNLMPKLSALENVTFPMWLAGVPADERTKKGTELLTLLDLGDRIGHKPTEMSGGEQQRVAIARSLANNPRIVLADEPTGNLDYHTGKQITDLLKKIQKKKNATLVMVTHERLLAKEADYMIEIEDGKIKREVRKHGRAS